MNNYAQNWIRLGSLVYYPSEEGIGYGTVSPAPLIEISDNVTLYTPEEAQRIGVKIKGETVVEEKCPVCGQFPCVCDDDDDGEKPTQITVDGTPAQTFQAIADKCHDKKIRHGSKTPVFG